MSPGPIIDVADFVDSRKIGGFLIRTAALCFTILIIDGFDTQAIAYVAPALRLDAPVNPQALGPVFSAGLLGLLIGALGFGFFADRFGRRTSLLLCVTVFGAFSLATAGATSLHQILLFRLLGGMGMGGAMPNAVALVAEYAPRRRRATVATLMAAGFSIGAASGGFVAAWLLQAHSWRAVFMVGGGAPFALLPALLVWLPESATLLTQQGRSPRRVAALLAALDRHAPPPPDAVFSVAEDPGRGSKVAQLFTEGRGWTTILIWIAFFTVSVSLFFVSNWLPIMIHSIGIPLGQAAVATGLFHLGGTFGATTLGRASDSFRPTTVLATALFCAAFWLALLGAVGAHIALIMIVVFATGFCVVGGQILTIALAGETYPTRIRSTGIGWGMGAGRLGGIFGPMLGAFLFGLHWPLGLLFLIAAIPALCASASVAAIGWRAQPVAVEPARPLASAEPV